MKKAFFVGLLIFSLLINVSVGIVIMRHWLQKPRKFAAELLKECPILSNEDMKKMSQVWSREAKVGIMETRHELNTKRAQILDLIAQNPGNLKPAESAIREMIDLRSTLENQILERVSKTMATLPPEKRQSFLEFLKHRTCRMMRSGSGLGKGGPACCTPGGTP